MFGLYERGFQEIKYTPCKSVRPEANEKYSIPDFAPYISSLAVGKIGSVACVRRFQQDACIRREGFTGAIIAILWLNMAAGSAHLFLGHRRRWMGLVGTVHLRSEEEMGDW